MRTKLFLLALFIVSTCSAQLKIDKQHFVDLLRQGKYGDCYYEAMELRKKEYGKCCMVDYFIAKALCADGHNENAVKKYAFILKNYKLNAENKTFINGEMTACAADREETGVSTPQAIDMNGFNMIMSMKLPEASVRGKMGAIYNCNMPPQAVTSIREVSSDELDARLFALNDGANAVLKYKSILNTNYHVRTDGRFVFITYGGKELNDDQLTKVSQKLEKTYAFFIKQYSLRPPDKLLAVYLLPDKKTFRETAQLVHGIKVPDANIGYSNVSDLSLVGISDVSNTGTLCHELFHLMVRTDVGDVPPWMDEGIASIYETSHWDGEELKGDLINWRSAVLGVARNSMREKIPSLRAFINYTWEQFDGLEDNDICMAAIDYAYGKHLMLYLQEQGQLATLLTAIKNRNEITNQPGAKTQSDIELFEQALNSPVDTIEKNFNKWFREQYKFNLADEKYRREPSFMEQWLTLSALSESLYKYKNKAATDSAHRYQNELNNLQTRFYNLKEAPVTVAPNEAVLQTQNVQQQVQSPIETEHDYFYAKEVKLIGLEPLKQELKALEKRIMKTEDKYHPKMAN